MGVKVQLPIQIFVDNVGAIQMVRNNGGGSGTRHLNIRFHFVREIHGEIIILKFVKSKDNDADILTKNTTQEEFGRHAPKMVGKVPENLLGKVERQDF